jgi:hypothetical protein
MTRRSIALVLSSLCAATVATSVLADPPAPAKPKDPAGPPAPTVDVGTPTRIDVRYDTVRSENDLTPTGDNVELREALGKLTFAKVSIDADDRPIREVVSSIARAMRLNLVPFYEGPDRPAPRLGMTPTRRVTLYLEDVDGRTLLEALAAQCGPEVTWQIQRGTIEFGPREVLAREDARSTRVYNVTDLTFEVPYFRRPDTNLMPVDRETDQKQLRLRPKDVVADLVRSISEQCEPDAFRPAPPPTEAEIAEGVKREQLKHTTPNTGPGGMRPGVNSTATRNLDPDIGPIYVLGQWAQIHVKETTIVVTAPDFVHRAIDGYPPPIPPRAR